MESLIPYSTVEFVFCTRMKGKNEVWNTGRLLAEMDAGNIVKPRLQRDQCWTEENEADFSTFTSNLGCIIQPFVFAVGGSKLILLDGNNRLNAIHKLLRDRPDISITIITITDCDADSTADIYRRINLAGIQLTREDILSATQSIVVYNEKNIPLYHNINYHFRAYKQKANTREVLQVALDEGGMSQREVIIGFREMLISRFPIAAQLGADWLAEAVQETRMGLAEFIDKVYSVFNTLDGLTDRLYPKSLGCSQLTGMIVELKPYVVLFALYSHLRGVPIGTVVRCIVYAEWSRWIKSKIRGVANPVSAVVKSRNPICDFRLVKNPPKNAGLRPIVAPTDEHFRYLINAVLLSLDNPTECGSKKERSKISAAYAILLASYHKLFYNEEQTREIEHIIPYSTVWAKGTKINIHRLGNLTVLGREYNQSRGNRELTAENAPRGLPYPKQDEYLSIVDKRRLLSAEAYNARCTIVEDLYIEAFLREYR